jgi:hypothetical protein
VTFKVCAKCGALSVDEQCALVEMVFKNFCIKLLTSLGMLSETARIFAGKAVKLDRAARRTEESSKP